MKNTYLLFFLLICVSSFEAIAQSSRFNQLGSSPRTLALGKSNQSTYVQSLDVLANPALIASQKTKYSSSYMHHNAFKGITNANLLAFFIKPDSSKTHFGFSLNQLSNNGVFDTRDLATNSSTYDFSKVSVLNSVDYGLKFILGKSISNKIAIGVSANLDLLSVADFSNARSVGADLGLQYKIDSSFCVGVMLENAFGKYYFWNQSSTMLQKSYFATDNYLQINSVSVQLPSLYVGASKKATYNAWFSNIFSVQANLNGNEASYSIFAKDKLAFNFGFGYEALLKNIVYVRAGWSDFQKISYSKTSISSQLGIGIGLKINKIMIDYTMANINKSLVSAQKQLISIQYNFEKVNQHNSTVEPSRF